MRQRNESKPVIEYARPHEPELPPVPGWLWLVRAVLSAIIVIVIGVIGWAVATLIAT
jgi:hypothetical protein